MSVHDELTRLLEPYAALFNVSSIEAMGLRALGAALILSAGIWFSKRLQRSLVRRIESHDSGNVEAINFYRRFIYIASMIIAISLALHTLGINLTHLFTTGGLIAVAAAFALKTLIENLVAGLIMRLEQDIKRGDVISTQDGQMVKVKEIGPRATIVRSKTDGDLIIPNSELVQGTISNYTYQDSLLRIEARVGVAYSSDLKRVRTVLEQTCSDVTWKSGHVAPQVLLDEFGESSVNYRIWVWIADPWHSNRLRSQLNEAIWWALKEADIVIAFPQRDVHLIQEVPTPK
jgi:small-conductance mechanosensitive channel